MMEQMEANVTFRYNLYNLFLLFALVVLNGCIFDTEQSFFSDEQADLIRALLRENGYSVEDNEIVDNYVEFDSDSKHTDSRDYFWLVLPEKEHKTLMLTKDINKLGNKFHGIKSPPRLFDTTTTGMVQIIDNYSPVESLIIISDSIVNVKILSIYKSKLVSIPESIT